MPLTIGSTLSAVTNGDASLGRTVVTPSDGAQTSGLTSNLVYVDPVSGSDTTGTGSVAAPFQTLDKATTYTGAMGSLAVSNASGGTRTGYPDWILIKEGTTLAQDDTVRTVGFTKGELIKTGYSQDEPMVITTYNPTGATTSNPRGNVTGARAKISIDPSLCYGSTIIGSQRSNASWLMDYICIIDIEFYDRAHDYTTLGTAVTITGMGGTAIGNNTQSNFILIEGCKGTYLTGFAGFSGGTDDQIKHQNLVLRRNISAYTYSTSNRFGLSVGFYVVCYGNLTIEDNIGYYNGWTKDSYVCANQLKISGTPVAGQSVTITLTNATTSLSHSVTYTIQTGDTTDLVCQGLVNAVNADATFQAAHVAGDFVENSAKVVHVDTAASSTVLTYSQTGSLTLQDVGSDSTSTQGQQGRQNLYSRSVYNHSVYTHPCQDLTHTTATSYNLFVMGSGVERTYQNNVLDNGIFYSGSGLDIWDNDNTGLSKINPVRCGDNVVMSTMGWSRGTSPGSGPFDTSNGINIGRKPSSINASVDNNIIAHSLASVTNQGLNFYQSTVTAATYSNNSVFDMPGVGSAALNLNGTTGNTDGGGNIFVTGTTPDASWPSATKNLADYAVSLGYTGADDLTKVHNLMSDVIASMNSQNWQSQFTANGINNYFRANFGKSSIGGLAHHGGKGLRNF